jgi:AcrR family transcriptional regulator
MRMFSEVGYEGTTTAGIAREAGVTQPLVHHHFASKEGLWRAAMDILFTKATRPVQIPPDTSPHETLLAITESFIRFVAEHPEVTRIITREGATPGPRLSYLVDRHLRAPFQQVVAVIREGQRSGLIAPHIRPDLLLFVMLGAGSHMFDVTAMARETVGIDATTARTRDDFVTLVRTLFEDGLFRAATERPRRHRGG